ncbi:Uma2 family endonuclease [Microcoleus sp. FACHB-1515]|uniref:Uma2 family endonuclease n=1 Tax=Cyanophyceae TaxID=3028117 RepID=UPI001684DF6F|nr:Uma2 family endonuclease [Microcoleus sp. FACHB-1515]MBD2092823.1 Uma2 family endonuclease [Microcoleus sp. FACHB-1515]
MVQNHTKNLTLEDFLQLPETKPASEYIDGQIIQKPMPQGKHSTIQGELTAAINAALKPRQIARAFPELRCTFGGRSIVPDIAVFTWDRIPVDANGEIANVFQAAPSWTIEILSPDQNQTKVTRNILHCLKHETELGWLIDPDERIILVYFGDRSDEYFEDPEAVISIPQFAADLYLTAGDIFSWLAR